jgi:hypothetical protein
MKKLIFVVFAIMLLLPFGFSQSTRLVLAEECTSSTCGPCASQNPAFDALLQANPGVITSIKYHVWWPAPGNDPMYLANTTENAARTNYYNINSVPHVQLDGNYFNGQPSQVTQSKINAAAAVPASFDIQVQHALSADEDSIYVNVIIEATEAVAGNMVAQVAVIEKHIHFSSPPGTNGEKDFYNVMKKMLPSSSGTVLPPSMAAGDYVILQYSWALENVYDNNELAVVAFVQNNGNKAIYQAATSSNEPLSPVYANDMQVTNISNFLATNCSGLTSPVVTIRNNGSNPLTSLQLEYSVNGIDTKTYNWTGNLAFLESANIQLDEFSFMVEPENQIIATGLNPNGDPDDYTANDTFAADFLQGPPLSGDVNLFILLDGQPQETTWELLNSAGDVIQSGGPYTTQGQQIVPLNIAANDCYDFIIYDEGGNGICCDNGVGYYAVIYNGNEVAFQGAAYGAMDHNEFSYDLVGIEEKAAYSSLLVYPIPAAENLNIEFKLNQESDVKVTLADMLGKVIYQNENTSIAGTMKYNINTSGVNAGMYLLMLQIGNETFTQKVTVK